MDQERNSPNLPYAEMNMCLYLMLSQGDLGQVFETQDGPSFPLCPSSAITEGSLYIKWIHID